MADYRYFYYDTYVLANVVPQDAQLFRVLQGGDALHTEAFTNSRGAGVLPNNEKFVVDWIGAVVDFNLLTTDDVNFTKSAFLSFVKASFEVLKAPLAMFISHSAYGGFFAQAVAANEQAIGLHGTGMALDKPITLEGGTAFYVRIQQNVAVSAAANLKIVLGGIYTFPGQ
jgi:hypothetical protein